MTAILIGPCCCKCCIILKFRLILNNRTGFGGAAIADVAEMEIYSSGGALLYSGNASISESHANYRRWGNLKATQSNASRQLINDTGLWEPGQETGALSFDASDIEWNDAVTQFCEGVGLKDTLKGGPLAFEDEYTIEPGPFQAGRDNWAYTQWHEVELCET